MHEPDTRVICFKSKDKMATSRQHGNVATHGVRPVNVSCGSIETPGILGKNEEIMPMKMNGMSNSKGRLNDQVVHLIKD